MIKFFICHTKERLLLLVIRLYLLSLKEKVKNKLMTRSHKILLVAWSISGRKIAPLGLVVHMSKVSIVLFITEI